MCAGKGTTSPTAVSEQQSAAPLTASTGYNPPLTDGSASPEGNAVRPQATPDIRSASEAAASGTKSLPGCQPPVVEEAHHRTANKDNESSVSCLPESSHSSHTSTNSYSTTRHPDEHQQSAGSDALAGPIAESVATPETDAPFPACSYLHKHSARAVEQQLHFFDLPKHDDFAEWPPLMSKRSKPGLQQLPECGGALVKALHMPPVTLAPFPTAPASSRLQESLAPRQSTGLSTREATDTDSTASEGKQMLPHCIPALCGQTGLSGTPHKGNRASCSSGAQTLFRDPDSPVFPLRFPTMDSELVGHGVGRVASEQYRWDRSRGGHAARPVCEGAECSDSADNPGSFCDMPSLSDQAPDLAFQGACEPSIGMRNTKQPHKASLDYRENESAAANLMNNGKMELIHELADLVISVFEEEEKNQEIASLPREAVTHFGHLDCAEKRSSGPVQNHVHVAAPATGVRNFLVSKQGTLGRDVNESCGPGLDERRRASRCTPPSHCMHEYNLQECQQCSSRFAADRAGGCQHVQPHVRVPCRLHSCRMSDWWPTYHRPCATPALYPCLGPAQPRGLARLCADSCFTYSPHHCPCTTHTRPDPSRLDARLREVIESPAQPLGAANCSHVPANDQQQHGRSKLGGMEGCASPPRGPAFLCVVEMREPPGHPGAHSLPGVSSSGGHLSDTETNTARWETAVNWVRDRNGCRGSPSLKPRRKALLVARNKRHSRRGHACNRERSFQEGFASLEVKGTRQADSKAVADLDSGPCVHAKDSSGPRCLMQDDLAHHRPAHTAKEHPVPELRNVACTVLGRECFTTPSHVPVTRDLTDSKQDSSHVTLASAHEPGSHRKCPTAEQKRKNSARSGVVCEESTEGNQLVPHTNLTALGRASANSFRQQDSHEMPPRALAAALSVNPGTVHLPKSLAWKLGIHGTIVNGQGHCIVVDEPQPRRPKCRQGKQRGDAKCKGGSASAKFDRLKRNVSRRHSNVWFSPKFWSEGKG